jgi:hypothetical protein
MMASFQKQKPVCFLSNRASCCGVRAMYVSFLCIGASGFRAPPQAGFRKAQLASACLRVAASAEAGAFLITLGEMIFSQDF